MRKYCLISLLIILVIVVFLLFKKIINVEIIKISTDYQAVGAGLKLRMKNNQKGFNFNFSRDDSKFI